MTERKKKVKQTKAPRRKQCSKKGCRKLRVTDEFCEAHEVESKEGMNPVDHVKKLSELDRLRFVEIDNEIRSASQQIKIMQLEQNQDSLQYDERRKNRQAHVDTFSDGISSQQGEYKSLMAGLGKTYGFNPAHVSIDDKTGVIRENKPEEPKPEPAAKKKPKKPTGG